MATYRSRFALDTYSLVLKSQSLIVPRFHYSTTDQYLQHAQSCQIGVHLLLRRLRRHATADKREREREREAVVFVVVGDAKGDDPPGSNREVKGTTFIV